MQNDIEQEVKRSSIEASGSIISHLHASLEKSKVDKCININLIEKLDNEGSRVQSLKALESIIKSSYDLSASLPKIIGAILPFIKMQQS